MPPRLIRALNLRRGQLGGRARIEVSTDAAGQRRHLKTVLRQDARGEIRGLAKGTHRHHRAIAFIGEAGIPICAPDGMFRRIIR